MRINGFRDRCGFDSHHLRVAGESLMAGYTFEVPATPSTRLPPIGFVPPVTGDRGQGTGDREWWRNPWLWVLCVMTVVVAGTAGVVGVMGIGYRLQVIGDRGQGRGERGEGTGSRGAGEQGREGTPVVVVTSTPEPTRTPRVVVVVVTATAEHSSVRALERSSVGAFERSSVQTKAMNERKALPTPTVDLDRGGEGRYHCFVDPMGLTGVEPLRVDVGFDLFFDVRVEGDRITRTYRLGGPAQVWSRCRKSE